MKTDGLKRVALLVPIVLLAEAADVAAQPTTFDACYMEKSGVIYLIDPTGTLPGDLPAECTKPGKHIQVGWTDADGADHGSLTGLGDDDHTRYVPVDGSRAMTGNLGIGTTSAPTSPLTIKPRNGAEIEFATGTGNNADILSSNEFRVGTTNGSPFSLLTGNQFRMTVLGNGNVGVGTFTPSEKLSVNGVIESTTGGVKFPDGTTQTTAAGTSSSPWAGMIYAQEVGPLIYIEAGDNGVFGYEADCPADHTAINGGWGMTPGASFGALKFELWASYPTITHGWRMLGQITNTGATLESFSLSAYALCVPTAP